MQYPIRLHVLPNVNILHKKATGRTPRIWLNGGGSKAVKGSGWGVTLTPEKIILFFCFLFLK